MRVFITSDSHFGHKNIIEYCNRPFADVDEMNAALIERWNSVVGKDDMVIHLGDVGLGSREKIGAIVRQLNGRKMLIMGNHDHFRENQYREMGFETVSRFPILWNKFFLLSHAPLELSETNPFFNIYGHIHTDEEYQDTSNSKCVCVERTNYTPIFLYDTITGEYGEGFGIKE